MKEQPKYNPKEIEPKWQEYWAKHKTFEVKEDKKKDKYYALIEFPYPSGEGLHVGHPRPFTAMDVVARKKRMEGYNVLYPMGFDAFGLPTENFAIKTGQPPADVTKKNIANFTRQLKALGYCFDWSRQVDTTDPKYYKWTQWQFLQFFKHGLAYKKNQPINWCPKDKIGLANEEVVNGCCERCGTAVEKRNKEQWMLAITKYADKLLEGLKNVDYIPQARTQQENWIGRSEGAEITFKLRMVPGQEDDKHTVTVFTTRPDTIFGATFLAISAELAKKWVEAGWQASGEVKNYIEKTLSEQKVLDRSEKEKTGVDAGIKAVNPVSQEEIPVWVTNYVLSGVGTGAIMAVPAHDERDFEFAKKYNLKIKEVVAQQLKSSEKNSKHRDCVKAVIFNDKGEVLITHEVAAPVAGVQFSLPGGGYEKGESDEEALKRELEEEIGVKNYSVSEFLGTVETNYLKPDGAYRIRQVKGFCVKVLQDTIIQPEKNGETIPMWVTVEDALKKISASDPRFHPEKEILLRATGKAPVCFSNDGVVVGSDFLNDLSTEQAKEKIIAWLEEKGVGKRQVNYKLRDWVFSRQRYWGEPIPLVFCEKCENKKYNFIIIHGYTSNSKRGFKPWLQAELEKQGHKVWNPDLPNTDNPSVAEQVKYILDNASFAIDEHTVLVGHSLGGAVAYKLLEKLKNQVAKVVLVDPVVKPEYNDKPRPGVLQSSDWKFNWKKIKASAHEFVILGDKNFTVIKAEHLRELSENLGGGLRLVEPTVQHFSSSDKQEGSVTVEPAVLEACQPSGWMSLPESELPLTLPKVEKYQPTDNGESPLAAITDWVNTKCPQCGGPAKRETDTMPNWAGSSWYFLRYADPHNDKEFASMEKLKYWTPVDWYNGGMEHTVLHLLYSRFWNQFLFDIGLVPTSEPYKKRTSHGLIMGPDGEKMSKSRGNVINPDEMIEKFGADALRTYIMFMGPFDQAVAWDTNGLVGVRRFLDKVWGLKDKVVDAPAKNTGLTSLVHQTIKKVSEDIEKMSFNTAVAALMEFSNTLVKEEKISKAGYGVLLKLASVFAPHMCEELWQQLGNKESIAFTEWPKYDAQLAKDATVTIAVQINGKVRDELTVDAEILEAEVKKLALSSDKVQKWLDGKEPKKVIYVKGKLISIVV